MKRSSLLIMAAAAIFAVGCSTKENTTGGDTKDLEVSFVADVESAYVGQEITLTPTVSGGVAPYTYNWECTDDITSTDEIAKITFASAGVKLVKLTVADSKGSKRSKSTTILIEEAPIEDKGDIKVAWYIDFKDEGGGVRSSSPAIDDEGNIYIETSVSAAGKVRKVASDGTEKASFALVAPGNTCMSVSIDSDGNIYAGGGSSAGGSFNKLTSALASTWTGEFWNKGAAASPKIWYGAAVQLKDYVLVANAGSTGTMGAISKTDGSRFTYVTSPEAGGPSGGCRQSPVVSNDGYVWQVCAANGVFGTTLSKLTAAAGAVVYDYYNKVDTVTNVSFASAGSDRPALCVASVGGVNYAFGVNTPEGNPSQIIRIAKDGSAKAFAINAENTSIANETAQDQGGAVVGNDGEIIVNLKSGAAADGGVVAIDGNTMTLAWEFRIAESVSCCPAVTKEGNVVFGTDAGNFYIVKPNAATKTAELVAKANISSMLQEAGVTVTNADTYKIKMWSNVTVGDDGKMYIGFQRNDATTSSGLLCLTSTAVTGPGTSCWPMFGVDRKHTGVQK